MSFFDARFENPWKAVPWGPEDRPFALLDGVLHRIKDLTGPIRGKLAWVLAVNDSTFPLLCDRLDAEEVRFYEMRVSDLQPMARMKSLQHLFIHWNTKVSDLSPLGKLNLKSLGLQDTPKVRDLDPLTSLKELQTLFFSGGMWNSNRAESLEPLASLPSLSTLTLLNLRVDAGGLRPLARCRALRRLEVSNQFATEDYAFLSARRPDIECDLFTTWVKINPLPDGEDVMVVGKGKPKLCLARDADRIAKYEQAFDELRQRFASL